MSDFAQPVRKLGESGIGVAAAPTGGMGLALTPDGKIPAGVLFAAARRIAVGSGSATWSASQFSATVAVAHGLGAVPVFWAAFCSDAGQIIHFSTGAAPTDTTVTFQGDATVSMSGTRNFVWVAIG